MTTETNPDRRLILDMLAQGKITAEDAERLLEALDASKQETTAAATGPENKKARPRHLCILVNEGPRGERINVRIPLVVLRSGMKLASFLPRQAHAVVCDALGKEGIHLGGSKVKAEQLDELLDQLRLEDLVVDLDDKHTKVRIFCE
jgi:hypothetical protein